MHIHMDLLQNCPSDIKKARILANVSEYSGSLLNVLLCSSLETLLDYQSFRVSIALRLSLPICHPHSCVCGKFLDKFERHGLDGKFSFGRKCRQETINDLIKRSLSTCGFLAIREPTGFSRSEMRIY